LNGLARINLITGLNGSGKTSILEAAFLISGAANASLAASLYTRVPHRETLGAKEYENPVCPRIELSGSIGSLLGFYSMSEISSADARTVMSRSGYREVKLTYGKEPPRDLLAGMKKERDKIEEEMHALEAQIEELETEHGYEMEASKRNGKTRLISR